MDTTNMAVWGIGVARFIPPMLLLRTDKLPAGSAWSHELKFDGFRAEAIKTNGKVYLRSRNDKDFNHRYPSIVKGLAPMPDETVIDGEIVALDPSGRPSFNALQNYGSGGAPLLYYVFDILILKGEDVRDQPLTRRRELLAKHVLAQLDEPIRESPELDASPTFALKCHFHRWCGRISFAFNDGACERG